MSTITLYDLPGTAAKDGAWSPNTWKVRFALNIKGLPYKTSWVEYPDIASLYKQLGARPTAVLPSGPFYSVPIISDSSTSPPTIVADSVKIVQYLDEKYPDTLPLFPKGTAALQVAFADTLFAKTVVLISPYMNVKTWKQLNPPSQEYWRRTREAKFGCKIEQIAPAGSEKAAQLWKGVTQGLSTTYASLSTAGVEKPFAMGDQVSFADVAIASLLTWAKRLLGEESKEWKEILEADGGIWGRYTDAFAKWEEVDEEGLKQLH